MRRRHKSQSLFIFWDKIPENKKLSPTYLKNNLALAQLFFPVVIDILIENCRRFVRTTYAAVCGAEDG